MTIVGVRNTESAMATKLTSTALKIYFRRNDENLENLQGAVL